jgi:hypothetical protein
MKFNDTTVGAITEVRPRTPTRGKITTTRYLGSIRDVALAAEWHQTMLDLDGLRPTPRHRGERRPNPDTLERAGAASLAAPRPAHDPPWILRVYYLSAGGDRCYADFGGLTRADALAWEAAHKSPGSAALAVEALPGRKIFEKCYGDCRKNGRLVAPALRAACEICKGAGKVETPRPAPRHGYREVVFPSEIPGLPEVVDWGCANP